MASPFSCRNKLSSTVRSVESESGLDLLVRLGCRPSLAQLEPCIFPEGPQPGDIIEVTGDKNCGKTALGLRMVVTALLPRSWRGVNVGGCDAGVIFVDCDMHFSILQLENMMQRRLRRLLKMGKDAIKRKKIGQEYDKKLVVDCEEMQNMLRSDKTTLKTEVDGLVRRCLKSLFYLRCTDSSQFSVTLLSIDELVVSKPNVSLIVVDSISAFYWYDRTYRAQSWYKLEQYYNKIFKVFLGHIKHHKLVLLSTRQSLFQKRTAQEDFQNVSSHHPEDEDAVDSSIEYQYMGKELASRVTWKIHLSVLSTPVVKNLPGQVSAPETSVKSAESVSVANDKSKAETLDGERQMYTADVTNNGQKYKLLFTMHEDGPRWIS